MWVYVRVEINVSVGVFVCCQHLISFYPFITSLAWLRVTWVRIRVLSFSEAIRERRIACEAWSMKERGRWCVCIYVRDENGCSSAASMLSIVVSFISFITSLACLRVTRVRIRMFCFLVLIREGRIKYVLWNSKEKLRKWVLKSNCHARLPHRLLPTIIKLLVFYRLLSRPRQF